MLSDCQNRNGRNNKMRILALEASTSSAKALYYNTDDETYEVVSKTYTGNYEDVTLHKADNVYLQLMQTGKELLNGRSADVIALGGAWHGVALFNKDMSPATPVFQWGYTGAADICRDLRKDDDYVNSYYNRTGCMVNAIYPSFKLKLLAKTYDLSRYYIMSQGNYNNYRMTGKRVTTDCMLSGSGLLNTHTLYYDLDYLREIAVSDEQFSEITSYKNVFPLTDEAASLLGLKSGIPVILCNGDGGLNQAGAGALAKGVMTFSGGTSGAIRLTTDKPILPDDCSTWCYRSPVSWMSGAATNGCTNCVDWFKNNMFPTGTSYSDIEKGIKDYETTPVFLPFVYGERCPGWNDERKGGFKNILPHHTSYDMYLAVQEGVLFNLYHCYQVLTSINGEPEHIRFSGGILHSELWTQICADIFQKELEVDQNEQASLMGGVVLAKEYLGLIDDVRNYMPSPSRIIYPNPDKAELYRKKFQLYLRYYYEGHIQRAPESYVAGSKKE